MKRETFGSRLGFILVSAGCAIGLGNVWKFPYICGQYGGAAFILIYLAFLAILGLPILICEFAVGRASGKGSAVAFDTLEPKQTKWHQFKWISLLGSYLLMMFYTMVAGWMIYYVYQMASGKLNGLDALGAENAFNQMLGSAPTMTFWMILTVIGSFAVCAMGLKNGIEKITKVMMCILIVLMLVLAGHSLFLQGAMEGVKFYLIPNFSLIKENGIGTVIYAAMSQAFFTLSIGIGAMEIFGSYMNRDRTLVGESISIVLLDTLVALTAGFIIIPACFAYNIEPGAGPSLLFITLPNVFNNMSYGQIWGTLFFIFMSFAALSTVIAVFENIIAFYIDGFGWSRNKAVIVNLILIILLSLPAVLGFNVLSDIQLMGEGTSIMDVEDFLVSYNLLPLGSMVFVLFCTHKKGWRWPNVIQEANIGKGMKIKATSLLKFYMSWILPLIIIVVYLKGYYDFFAGHGRNIQMAWMCFAVILLGAILLRIVKISPKKSNRKSA